MKNAIRCCYGPVVLSLVHRMKLQMAIFFFFFFFKNKK